MGKTMCYKILSAHLMEGNLKAGETITVKIDQTLTQDATGTMAYLQFEAMGLDKVKNELEKGNLIRKQHLQKECR